MKPEKKRRPRRHTILPVALLVALLAAPLTAVARPPEEAGTDPGARIAAVERAPPAERPRRIHELAAAGAAALDATRKARDAAADPELRRAYARAAMWQLAAKISPRLREGFESQLTFDGQYDELASEGPEVVAALLAIADDAAGEPAVRLTAFKALADVVRRPETGSKDGAKADRELLSKLRKLYHDPLLPPALKEQAGFLLAILGDTHAVDSRIAKFERQAKTEQFQEKLESHGELAELYYRIRDYEKALRSYDEILSMNEKILEVMESNRAPREEIAVRRRIYALQLYNAACSSSLGGRVEKAKDLLRKAVEYDPMHYGNMEKDGDLANLRKSPGYAAFRRELGKKFDKEEI